ncbi:hypothetical protein JNB88_31445 [Rhizobium cauense]|uniref:hypothetical protein n=1 Tax=Rhizobium cauense TaxID=1166683 RepID=UPI001C6E9A07|nr:hypothetical protein [Rhizobium cauense]MBW9118131.1 hypothetical protein [Rhizobium cauense]
MPYVASPSYCEDARARSANLAQCLAPARRFLDETSNASEAEKIEMLVSSAAVAGWDEDEVRQALQPESETPGAVLTRNIQETATIGLVPTSANTP